MRKFVITDNDSRIVLSTNDTTDRSAYGSWVYTVHLKANSVEAEVSVNDHKPGDFCAFFDDLAANWKGWDGTKNYESLEPALTLTAEHDGKSMCLLGIVLKPNMGDWSASNILYIEAGSLGQLARSAKAFTD